MVEYRIKELMSEKGIMQKELAEKFGVTTAYLSMMLNDKCDMTPPLLDKMAEALGVEVWELFKRKEEDFTFVAKVGKEYKCTTSTGEALEILDKLGE